MELRKYVGKTVRLIDLDNEEWVGKAKSLDLAINYDDVEFDELALKVEGLETTYITFPENEIKSIEIIK